MVDEAVGEVVPGRQGQRVGGRSIGLLVGLLPQDGGASFGADHGIPCIFEHSDSIAGPDAQRPARPTLPDDHADDRCMQAAHFAEVGGDRFRLPALLRLDAGIRARRVDQRHHRQTELLRQLHLRQGLAISLRVGAAEVAGDLLLGGLAFLMPDDHHLVWADPAEPGDDGRVVAEAPIAVQLAEVSAHHFEVVGGLRPFGMPGHPHNVPRAQAGVDLLQEAVATRPQGLDLRREVLGIVALLQCRDLLLQLDHRLLERQAEAAALLVRPGHGGESGAGSADAAEGRQSTRLGRRSAIDVPRETGRLAVGTMATMTAPPLGRGRQARLGSGAIGVNPVFREIGR